jgi:hypothetical protein
VKNHGGNPCACSHEHGFFGGGPGVSRRGLLGGGGFASAIAATAGAAETVKRAAGEAGPPKGATLRVHPVLTYEIPRRQDRNSWRNYGAIDTMEKVNEEAGRIGRELAALAAQAEFPLEFLPVSLASNAAETEKALGTAADALLIFAAGGWQIYPLAAAKTPKVVFIRHKSGPYYLWHEIAHWRLLRGNGDTFTRHDIGLDDIVVDKYDEVLWRLRALYGLKNAKGTRMLAIGGLAAYSEPGQENGPRHARELWDYGFEIVSEADFARRLEARRKDPEAVKAAEKRTTELLAHPGVKLATERRYVFNSVLALDAVKEILVETGCSNFGFAYCMARRVIEILDTPPCMVLSMANDEGYTAYCHTDLTHTTAGVLLHWISGKPTFVCNSHFPHDGLYTVAHCQAPRKMNGKTYEPAAIMTHFESDYGAAVKVQYTKGQMVTAIIPNLRCTKWQGFRGKIVDAPSHPTCRSQMDIAFEGDWRTMLREMEGFHHQVCYGDYLREVGYALQKLGGIEWQNFSVRA